MQAKLQTDMLKGKEAVMYGLRNGEELLTVHGN